MVASAGFADVYGQKWYELLNYIVVYVPPLEGWRAFEWSHMLALRTCMDKNGYELLNYIVVYVPPLKGGGPSSGRICWLCERVWTKMV